MNNARPRTLRLARLFCLVVVAGALGALGCSSGSADGHAPQTSASALTRAPVGSGTHGAVKLVGDALAEVALRPDQRTELEKLANDAELRHAALVAGRKELMGVVADGVEKGSLDHAAIRAKIDALVAEADKVRPADQAALARVHAILDPEQRGAFVDAIEAKIKDRRHGHARGAHLKQLAQELGLTDAQRAQIRDIFKEAHAGAEMKHARGEFGAKMREGKKALESFRTPTFDPAAFPHDAERVHGLAAEGTPRMLGVAEKILPILTPEQRKLAADKLRARAESGDLGPLGGQ